MCGTNSQSYFDYGQVAEDGRSEFQSQRRASNSVRRLRPRLLAGTVLTLAFALPPCFAAAETPSTAENQGEQSSLALEEIVVTAQRQAQDILSVPMAISAISGEQLVKYGIQRLDDIQLVTPGLYDQSGTGQDELYIRGIGNNVRIGADPSVALFVDDVPRIYGHIFTKLTDVDRIEVLKGAQGGLYGRNATGGVVNIITLQPSTEKYQGNALVAYGEQSTFRAAGYINVPLNDKIAWSVAAERDSHDDYVNNIATPNPYTAAMFPKGSFLGTPQQTAAYFNSGIHQPSGVDNGNIWAVDSKLLLKPSDIFKITIAGDYNDEADTVANNGYSQTPAYVQAVQGSLFKAFGITANLPPGFFPGSNGNFTTTKPIFPYGDLLDYGGSATAVLSMPTFDVTSISADRHQTFTYFDDLNNAPVSTLDTNTHYHSWYFYQELRAVSTGTGPIHWLGGATYLTDHVHSASATGILLPLVEPKTSAESISVVHNWSAYIQGGYDFTRALNLTVSVRYIHETNNTSFILPVGVSGNSLETKPLPSATLSYKFEDGGNAYARWARGFKTGGTNPLNAPTLFPNPNEGAVFQGETVNTYEIGYRAPLFDRRVALTTAVFYNDYQNLQISAHANAQHPLILIAIVNGGDARTYGAEESLTWRVIEPLTLGVNAAYLDAKYKNLAVTDSTVLVPFNLSGQTMLNSPLWQLSLTANIDQPLNDKLNLVGNILLSYVSDVLLQQSGLPGVLPNSEQPGYWLTNARLGVRTSDGRYEFAVIGDNLFNKAYITGGSSTATTGNAGSWGNPRIIRGEIAVKF